jgi:acylphosphatase
MSQGRAIRRVVIRGYVQGVGFRAWTEHAATRRALEGWARNRRDGAVEAVFAGPPETVADMIEACRRGPPMSRVDALEVQDAHLNDLGQRRAGEAFSLLPTV